jgi:hypothetical protein
MDPKPIELEVLNESFTFFEANQIPREKEPRRIGREAIMF